MLKLTDELLIDEKVLNKEEAAVFIKFLDIERQRHVGDINKIALTMDYLEKKWGIK